MIMLTNLKKRDDLGEWLNQHGLLGTGLEVGSLDGEFARTVISKWNGKMLVMLDPWERQDPEIYKEPVNDRDWGSAHASCQALADEYPGRIRLVKDYSPQASAYFSDGELDWIYIDANHSYDACSADLIAWWPKVKGGGLFGGHDARNEIIPPQNCEVKRALEDWTNEYKLPFPYITKYPGCYSWWIIK